MMARRAVFLDRDGVLCREKGYVARAKDMELFDFARASVAALRGLGFLCVVVTNQSGVARGLVPLAELLEMNRRLVGEAGVDAVYFCPHYEGGAVAEYAVACSCRKPKTGMVERARDELGIDLAASYMVGDRAADIVLGKRAGMKTVLLESGYGTARLEEPVEPDFIMEDLARFADYINDLYKRGEAQMPMMRAVAATEDFYGLIAEANVHSEPITIINSCGKNAVLISEDTWNTIQETVYLNSVPGLVQSIHDAASEPPEECKVYIPSEEW